MISQMKPKSLAGLHDLAALLTAGANFGERLEDLAHCAARATLAASCSISLLAEDDAGVPRLELFASTEALPGPARREAPGPGSGIASKVIEGGKAILIADIRCSEFASATSGRGSQGGTYIGIPIIVDGHPIGVMNLSKPAGARAFIESDLSLAGIVVALIGKSLQVERLQTLLRSRVAQLTLVREEKRVAERLTGGTLPPSRLAKLLAKSFYRDLADAGFEPGQIIEAASEIIDQITTDVARFGKRLARQGLRR